ncbi:hypothetical protein FHX42_001533 [Saccharopolyspora lacisalsi]|uniref:Uncharacterized protein n=1 Tax=Halosaccharopolyspora lacisalsi TaxID=1000566 RepID=A0A839DRR3_9PSEU|nr:hypothetical protein [Halosaccharopolyspora lacisalsi]
MTVELTRERCWTQARATAVLPWPSATSRSCSISA